MFEGNKQWNPNTHIGHHSIEFCSETIKQEGNYKKSCAVARKQSNVEASVAYISASDRVNLSDWLINNLGPNF